MPHDIEVTRSIRHLRLLQARALARGGTNGTSELLELHHIISLYQASSFHPPNDHTAEHHQTMGRCAANMEHAVAVLLGRLTRWKQREFAAAEALLDAELEMCPEDDEVDSPAPSEP
ncbi:hypothetical protein Q8F55_004113 [Vanrija albida]|uniref:Uncharacterized protein n=1 Tax=Vanrija albida TaxID=181172 RepID=A0ABR3Q5V2_9TREE